MFVFLFHADNVNLTIVQGRLELLNPLLQLVNFTPKGRHAILTLHTITTTCWKKTEHAKANNTNHTGLLSSFYLVQLSVEASHATGTLVFTFFGGELNEWAEFRSGNWIGAVVFSLPTTAHIVQTMTQTRPMRCSRFFMCTRVTTNHLAQYSTVDK